MQNILIGVVQEFSAVLGTGTLEDYRDGVKWNFKAHEVQDPSLKVGDCVYYVLEHPDTHPEVKDVRRIPQ